MPTLVVIADTLRAERRSYVLRAGATLAAELMRFWPAGLAGSWRIYRDEVAEENELAAVDLPLTIALEGETYLVVRDMAGPVAPFIFNAVVAFLLTKAVEVLMPIRLPRTYGEGISDIISPNNRMAGQTNQLRPGARVPEILGRVRAYPDLLIRAVDTYTESEQTIQQVFVLGMGAYDYTDEKLGDTPLSSVHGARLRKFLPGEPTSAMYVMRPSPEVQNISLIADETEDVEPSPGTDFIAATKQMRTLLPVATAVGRPISISQTLFNNGIFWVTVAPLATQTVGPYLYTLDGPVSEEPDTNAEISHPPEIYSATKTCYFGKANPYDVVPPNDQFVEIRQVTGEPFEVGDLVSYTQPGPIVYHGRVTTATGPVPLYSAYLARNLNAYGANQHYPTRSNIQTAIKAYRTSGLPTRTTPRADPITNKPTDWYAVPFADTDEVWIDVEFPRGLARYFHGERQLWTINVLAEFRRAGATSAACSVAFSYVYGTATPLRFTERLIVADLIALGLPASTAIIEVRLTRTTKLFPDDPEGALQYVDDTRWARLAAVRLMESETYEKATVLFLDLSNSRGATSLGETSLNVVATRRLPSWTGSGWTTPAASFKWADNFVARCMAADGAHRTEAQLDLAGIYAIQTYLDNVDPKLGEIGLTLDVMQDIDTELAQVADVVRGVVYRVGRKIFVTRDQANATSIALFNARAKAPDGESVSVRMTADADNDCVIVPWVDSANRWRRREYKYPEDALAVNPLRVPTVACNWEQAYRRALFELNRLKYRREQMSCSVTEDGRLCRPGDVINMSDDIANLATSAGEVIEVAGSVLTLDRDVAFDVGAHSILLRDVEGILLDRVPVTAGAAANKVQLSRNPTIEIRGRDTARGTLFAFYPDANANVRRWLLTGLAASGPYVQLSAVNYSDKVYTGDSAPMPAAPILILED